MFELSEGVSVEEHQARGSILRYGLVLLLGCLALLHAPPGLAPIAQPHPSLGAIAHLEEVALRPVAPLAPIIQAIASDIASRFHVARAQALRITRAAFQSSAEHHAVHPALVLAVAAIESRYQPEAVNASGARGLMQVMPEAHPDLLDSEDEDSLLQIEPNIRAGTAILAKYSRHGQASVHETLSRYLGSAQASRYVTKIQAQIRHLFAVAERATPAGFLNPVTPPGALLDPAARTPGAERVHASGLHGQQEP